MFHLCAEVFFPSLDAIAVVDAIVAHMVVGLEGNLKERVLLLAHAHVPTSGLHRAAMAVVQGDLRVTGYCAPQLT